MSRSSFSTAAANVVRWHERMASESGYASYTIIPPQIDRGSTAGQWKDELLQVGVAEEIVTSAFILILGAIAMAAGLAVGLGNRELAGRLPASGMRREDGGIGGRVIDRIGGPWFRFRVRMRRPRHRLLQIRRLREPHR